MRFRFSAAAIGAAALLAACAGAPDPAAVPDERAARVQLIYLAGLDTLAARLDTLETVAGSLDGSVAALAATRAAFVSARRSYKRIEVLLEQFQPAAAEELNGPVLDQVEENDPNLVVQPPSGFQVIEERLFSGPRVADPAAVANEVRIAQAHVRRIRAYAPALQWTDAHVLDAARLELARIASLGLAGFDSPVAELGLVEAVEALHGIRAALAPYSPLNAKDAPAWTELAARLDGAADALAGHSAFRELDRLSFLVRHLGPASESLARLRASLAVPLPAEPRLWRAAAPTPFAPHAFDAAAFAPPGAAYSASIIELGRQLFFDPVLSGSGERACSFCHDPARAFADGRVRSLPLGTAPRAAQRNTPTVINAALQAATFYDLRTAYLEDQVADVVSNAAEMHGSLEQASARLDRRDAYRRAFAQAYAGAGPAVTGERIRSVLAAYLRSLEALDSRFDRALRGDTSAVSAEERLGFTVFMGKGKCGSCHFFPLFNGTVPPIYQEAESEVIGVPERVVSRGARVDPDEGRIRVTRNPLHRFAFKTPTLRNVALTAPYMHNGVFRTLDDVVEFYDAGGGAGIGIDLPNQTLATDSLQLTRAEKRALVAFMESLTDTVVNAPGAATTPE
jgi:cytochrome c peroxidase